MGSPSSFKVMKNKKHIFYERKEKINNYSGE
jgi:hypothetical protein